MDRRTAVLAGPLALILALYPLRIGAEDVQDKPAPIPTHEQIVGEDQPRS